MLQLKAMEMGVSMDRTPKCHCELAGEGIDNVVAGEDEILPEEIQDLSRRGHH